LPGKGFAVLVLVAGQEVWAAGASMAQEQKSS